MFAGLVGVVGECLISLRTCLSVSQMEENGEKMKLFCLCFSHSLHDFIKNSLMLLNDILKSA